MGFPPDIYLAVLFLRK